MSEPFVLFGLSVNPGTAVLVLAAVCLIIGYALGASFSTRGVTVKKPVKGMPKEDIGVLKGITSMLANDTDQAIKELSRAVERHSENVETYIALGHLFRTKGQLDRAVAIRQSIIARRNVPRPVRIQALFDMGIDYHQGGFLSRSIEAFEQVLQEDARHQGALKQMISVFEELKQWDKAFETQKRLDKLTGRSKDKILAHFKCEAGKQAAAAGDTAQAMAAFKKALTLDRSCVDALLSLGELQFEAGDLKKSLTTWRKINQADPGLFFLALEKVIGREWSAREAELVDQFIVEASAESRDPRAQLIAARHLAARGLEDETVQALNKVLETSQCYLPAHKDLGLVLLEKGNQSESLAAYKNILDCLEDINPQYQCRNCGFNSSQLFWNCPSCRHWDSIVPIA